MPKAFKLGPLQRKWLRTLEKYPRRKITGALGEKSGKSYKACCLGAALICLREFKGMEMPFDSNNDIADGGATGILENSYRKLGLRDSNGEFKHRNEKEYDSLTEMNDGLNDRKPMSWPAIAKYIRQNPRNVFTKSV